MDEAQLNAITDRFSRRRAKGDSWPGAFGGFSALSESRAGRLIDLGSDKSFPFNWITNYGPETPWPKLLATGPNRLSKNSTGALGRPIEAPPRVQGPPFEAREERHHHN